MGMSMEEFVAFEKLQAEVAALRSDKTELIEQVKAALRDAGIPKLRADLEALDKAVRKLEKKAPRPSRPPMPPTKPPKILTDLGLAAGSEA